MKKHFVLHVKRVFAIAVLCLIAISVQAQQINFYKQVNTIQTEFSYLWKHKNDTFQLRFDLNNDSLNEMPNSPVNYNQKALQDWVYNEVMWVAKSIDPRESKVKITRKGDRLGFSVESRKPGEAQRILDNLTDAYESAKNQYWDKHFFVQYQSEDGTNLIRHDHARYAQLSSGQLKPIVDAIVKAQQSPGNRREFINIALSWIQNIPYDRLTTRRVSNAAGLISPRDLLLQNRGDCDSKSTLMAAILKAYDPKIKVKMVYLSDHALLAIAVPAKPNELTVTQQGVTYVLVEPTGPAQYEMGEVADSTRLELRNRQFQLIRL